MVIANKQNKVIHQNVSPIKLLTQVSQVLMQPDNLISNTDQGVIISQ